MRPQMSPTILQSPPFFVCEWTLLSLAVVPECLSPFFGRRLFIGVPCMADWLLRTGAFVESAPPFSEALHDLSGTLR